ncbi:protein STAY-GREEN, chloroplastic-like [Carica papaya]|uniref:protein STAY-GREEN, chloroplastic-like n=1 Tax=Carica papaya TaxID=3649 RepID=UPI000B8CEB4B|nr:protein STAY-GREEN, chloroplastic-like [Carica papaya]
MGTLTAPALLPSMLKPSLSHQNSTYRSARFKKKNTQVIFPVARLFGPAIFEASKLKVLFVGVDEKKHPGNLPRAYTLTHSDITAKLTLAISHTINNSQLQGWYNKIYRDEVVAEWKKVRGNMSLHVHCHISGGHFLLDLCARLRYFIFCKELPVVLKAFIHGDGNLFRQYPELEEALVWVYFHSNIPEFNKVECWGPIKVADGVHQWHKQESQTSKFDHLVPEPCREQCNCCFPPMSLIPWLKHSEENGSPARLPSTNLDNP